MFLLEGSDEIEDAMAGDTDAVQDIEGAIDPDPERVEADDGE